MSKNIVLDVENVSKQYRLGEVGTGSLQHDIKRWWANVRGKEDPYLKIGETNDRTQKGDSDYVWALRDINFQVEQGQAVGIIGRNGAGKSTLLKLLSRVTKPTTGSIKYNGRIASLLEVGTGFHPEMTGRENIYLNGAILGMTRKEITRKFDEIVNFAGVERYIDTPVKRYSSGMYVRLAFAVAAHLESEILIVDEVLAVGDSEFQNKCISKMSSVTKNEGRTILFVSHNMDSISKLCETGVYLENGMVTNIGGIADIVNIYNNSNDSESKSSIYLNDDKIINRVEVKQIDNYLLLECSFKSKEIINKPLIGFVFYDTINMRPIFGTNGRIENVVLKENLYEGTFRCKIDTPILLNGNYLMNIWLSDGVSDIDSVINRIQINIKDMIEFDGINLGNVHGPVYPSVKWDLM